MPLLLGLIRIVPAIISAFALFFIGLGAGLWWEHRAPGFPTVKVWFFKWKAPDSLAAQRDKARADLKSCRENEQALSDGLDRQNDAVANLEREGSRRLAESAKALERARAGTADARKRAGVLLNTPPVGIDQCQRWEDADEAVLRSLAP